MERKDNLPKWVAPSSLPNQTATGGNLTSSSSSSNASPVSPTELVRQVKAVIKLRKPLGARAGRVLGPLKKPSKSSSAFAPPIKGSNAGNNVSRTLVPMGATQLTKEKPAELGMTPLIDSSLTPPSVTSTFTGDQEVNVKSNHSSQQNGDSEMFAHEKSSFGDFQLKSQAVQASEVLKDVQPPSTSTIQETSQKDNGVPGNKINVNEKVLHQQDAPNLETSISGAPIYGDLEKGKEQSHNQHCFQPATQSTLMHSSYATTISLHLAPTFKCTDEPSAGQAEFPTKMAGPGSQNLTCLLDSSHPEGKRVMVLPSVKDNQGLNCENIVKRKVADDVDCLQPQAPSTISSSSISVSKPPHAIKTEKATRRKKYDHNAFFSVNGKQYQKLGKIGSGGSSEVFKVISADCTIYALKKIRLKGRDYATTYGFCQEIGYLTKLKGKHNIIQLIDYEVTDKTLLKQAMEESITLKDGKITNDEYIYMVLEYGEIDLAHMLVQKCKDVNGSSWNIDQDWLRFFWKKMLEAVNTIHEERIVHSDLKPANFLLVKGSLKLIDFGIAKAIMSDTTNIRRDSQAGTPNYMSPEACMFNEQDQTGGTIKCGRPSDVWSLGCILYQMVYGKTPFCNYTNFYAKIKAITDPSHEIIYEPVANPQLIDLMKQCLAWDCNKRWRIPQLLMHPFFVPHEPRKVLSPGDEGPYKLLFHRLGLHQDEPGASRLCSVLLCAISKYERDCECAGMNQPQKPVD